MGLIFLLVAFKEAKLSILEFDVTQNRFVTVSLHYYERDEFKHTLLENHCSTQIRVDPNHRCSALLMYGTKLALLPFYQKEYMAQSDATVASQQPYHPSYVIDLCKVGPKVLSVIDVCFLYSYLSPTLAVLYTTERSHVGSAYRPDTVGLFILSIDLMHRTCPVIFQSGGLPIDALRIVSMPKPTCGVLVVCSSSIIHINQGSSGYGMSLNGFSKRVSSYSHTQYLDLPLTFEGSSCVFLGPTEILISLQDGSLYTLQVNLEGSRVASFRFERSGSAVPASTACRVGPSMLFLGSFTGDSLLVRFKKVCNDIEQPKIECDEPMVLADLDDLYNEPATQGALDPHLDIQTTSDYTFEVVESWLNIGPVANIAFGSSEYLWEYLDEELPQVRANHNDIVCCSGQGKSGALSILQRNLRPKLLSEFDLAGCQFLWTLRCGSPASSAKFHDYLVISKTDRTLTLSAGQELKEVEGRQFFSTGPTVAAGAFPSAGVLVQIYKTGIRLLNPTGHQVHTKTLASNRRPEEMVAWGQICDPFIIIQRGDASLSLFSVKPGSQELVEIDMAALNQTRSKCSFIFKDTRHTLKFHSEAQTLETLFRLKASTHLDNTADEDMDVEVDLYGQESSSSSPPNAEPSVPTPADPRYFLFDLQANGTLNMYLLPGLALCYTVPYFDDFASLITGALHSEEASQRPRTQDYLSPVAEIGVFELGLDTYLLVRGEHDEFIGYQFFPDYHFGEGDEMGRHEVLAVRMNRLSFGHMLWNRPPKSKQDGAGKFLTVRFSRFCSFSNLTGFQGVFVAGKSPLVVVVTSKNDLRVHLLTLDDEVVAFAPLHNPNCPHGFAYYTRHGSLRLAQLPPYYRLDLELPARKVPLGSTPHHIAYHAPSRTYGLIHSTSEPFQPTEDFPAVPDFEETGGYQPGAPPHMPSVTRFSLSLVSPITWEMVDTHTFSPNERVTACIAVGLETKYQARRTFLAVSTSFNQGEEVVIRGRIHLFDIIDVVPEINNPRTNHKLKLLVSEDIKGPVTALAGINGYLVSCVGSKIIIRSFRDGEGLDGVAFIDVQIYVCSVTTIKNFILIGDAYKSVWFLGFQEEPPKLILLGKDFNNSVSVQATQFLIQGPSLAFLVSDQSGNCFVMNYAPKDIQSINGQKLIYRGDFNMGRLVINWIRLPCASAALQLRPSTNYRLDHDREKDSLTEDGEFCTRFFALGGTVEGSIVVMIPTNEAVYRRLHLLSSGLINNLAHFGGLNPRSYRLITPKHRLGMNAHKSILDGDLLSRFADMPTNHQASLAQSIGTSRNVVYGDLLRLLHVDLQIL
ncbi:mRNA cleavage and polyadenylation factor subunit [Entomophthora muscae]|uniref:mRNA cleavage and polyadenylation factor subunit n=1 Tax=Entomophthora muscae TaxID=34485 RepID=A0ACC2RU03_9FUNG|nr:mRNA cleavage and polyadenylation factor subunit [Entomophthora muscae]